MIPFDIWLKEVQRLSKDKIFSRSEQELLKSYWEADYEPISAVVVLHDLRTGGEGVCAEDDE